MHKSAVASARGSHDRAEGVGLLVANGGGGRTMQLPCWVAMHPCSLPKLRVCFGENSSSPRTKCRPGRSRLRIERR